VVPATGTVHPGYTNWMVHKAREFISCSTPTMGPNIPRISIFNLKHEGL
jgi:hypothetical protein